MHHSCCCLLPLYTTNTTTTTTNHDNFVSVYLHFHPHAAAVDAHGNPGAAGRGFLPLHVACAHWSSRWSDHDTALRTVLQAHPPAAAMRDDRGRLPLHVALSKAANHHKNHHRNRHHYNNRVLQQLVAAFPAALERRCPVTGLFPFQMAAAAGSQEAPPRDDDDDGGLNAIYDLLRACPQAAVVGQRHQ